MDKISAYALPKQIAYITDLPRNQLGKVLRRGVQEQLLDPVSKIIGQASRTVTELVTEVGEAAWEALPIGKPAEDEAKDD